MNSEHAIAASGWSSKDWEEFLIVGEADVVENVQKMAGTAIGGSVGRTDLHKCGRCWRHLPEVASDGDLCNRCEDVVNG